MGGARSPDNTTAPTCLQIFTVAVIARMPTLGVLVFEKLNDVLLFLAW